MRTPLLVAVLVAPLAGGCGLLTAGSVKVPPPVEVRSESGLVWADLRVGDGEEARAGTHVVVNYAGRLLDGTVFDSTYQRGEPLHFEVGAGAIMRGLDEGVLGMRGGGQRRLTIPPELGYGERGVPPVVPPGATLEFDVELLRVE